MDIKELIIAGAEAANNMGIGQLLWTGELENNKQWKEAFERVEKCRHGYLESMANPRVGTSSLNTIPMCLLNP
jgi:hypothetical protein